MKYQRRHIQRLRDELVLRFDELMRGLYVPNDMGVPTTDTIDIDGMRVRLAVDDFKAVLSEVRRLK